MKTYSSPQISPITRMVLGVAVLITAFSSCKKSDSTTPLSSTKKLNLKDRSLNAIPSTISNGLVAYWTFANTAYDLSGNGNNGTLSTVTTTSDRFGNSTGAYSFNGTSSYVSVPDNAALRLNDTSFTLNAWVKIAAYNSSYGSVLLSKRITGANNGWNMSVTGNLGSPIGVLSYGPGGGSTNAVGATVIGLNSWHMVTSTYSYGNHQKLRIYVDGALSDSTINISKANASITAMLYIGADNPSIGTSYFFNGSLNDIRIYSRAITPTEINQLYNATTAPTAGLVAYWPLTNTANDLSGNGNNGTLSTVTTTSDRFGNPIGAYSFNGTSSYVSVPDNAALRLNDTSFTLNAWVKIAAYNSSYGSVLLSKRITGANNGWNMSVTGNLGSPIGVLSYGPGGGSTNAVGATVIGLNSWHMVTSTYSYGDHQKLRIYVDGALSDSTINISKANASITAMLYIGADNPSIGTSYFFNGSLNDIRIYSRAVTATEINQLYNALN
ncbi:Concanavalin A-like lectin/glucanases superfamily protein [Mucilaginibacter mallensis]|uniref:Concanavalin A-like lectin/glucanases superfamily protein n=1 Tax=Mucilaginibacter mallensis TaxID=652787 RepID=A0A1H1NHQ6_MUCMA|nr:LamG domain-containing protein [Mucilaginibacter mallensis]SDR98467.1 Concanavalin A-like lectin/glucanases superfamily protein [Mucilaginibacter mallensis]